MASVRLHFGETDEHIPPEMVRKHREELPQMDVYTYPADHSFDRDGSESYHEASAQLALERTWAFFERHLDDAIRGGMMQADFPWTRGWHGTARQGACGISDEWQDRKGRVWQLAKWSEMV